MHGNLACLYFRSVSAHSVPQRLKPEEFISFIAGLKTCSTPLWDTLNKKRYKALSSDCLNCMYGIRRQFQ